MPAHHMDTRHPPAVTHCPSLGTPGGPVWPVEVERRRPAQTRARTASRKPRAPRAAERANSQSGSALDKVHLIARALRYLDHLI